MEAIIDYIQANWVPWLFAILGVILGDIIRRLRNQKKESNAIGNDVATELYHKLLAMPEDLKEREE